MNPDIEILQAKRLFELPDDEFEFVARGFLYALGVNLTRNEEVVLCTLKDGRVIPVSDESITVSDLWVTVLVFND